MKQVCNLEWRPCGRAKVLYKDIREKMKQYTDRKDIYHMWQNQEEGIEQQRH